MAFQVTEPDEFVSGWQDDLAQGFAVTEPEAPVSAPAPNFRVTEPESSTGFQVSEPERQVDSVGAQLMDLGQSIKVGAYDAWRGMGRGIDLIDAATAKGVSDWSANKRDELLQEGAKEDSWKVQRLDAMARTMSDISSKELEFARKGQAARESFLAKNDDMAKGIITDVGRGIGGMWDIIPASMTMGTTSLLTAPTRMFDEGYSQAIATGHSEEEAVDIATAYLFSASPLEIAADMFIFKGKGKATQRAVLPFLKEVAKKMGVNFVSEGTTEVLQDAILNKFTGQPMFSPESMRTFLVSGIVGSIAGGGFGTITQAQTERRVSALESSGLSREDSETAIQMALDGDAKGAEEFIHSKNPNVAALSQALYNLNEDEHPLEEKEANRLASLVTKDEHTDSELAEIATISAKLDPEDQQVLWDEVERSIEQAGEESRTFDDLISRLKHEAPMAQEAQDGDTERNQTDGTEQQEVTGQQPDDVPAAASQERADELRTAEEEEVAPLAPYEAQVEAERLGILFQGMQDMGDGTELPMFVDSKTRSSFLVEPGQSVESKLAEIRGEEVAVPIAEDGADFVGTSNDVINELRKEEERGEMPEAERETIDGWTKDAIDGGFVERAESVADEIIATQDSDSPRQINPVESKANDVRRAQIRVERRALNRERKDAMDRDDRRRMGEIDAELSELLEINDKLEVASSLGARINAKAQAARSLRAMNIFDYTHEEILSHARRQKDSPLTPEETERLNKLADDIEAAQDDVEGAESAGRERNLEQAINDLKENIEFISRNIDGRKKKNNARSYDQRLIQKLKAIVMGQDNLFEFAKILDSARNSDTDNFVQNLKNLPAQIRESNWYKQLLKDADTQPGAARKLETLERKLAELTAQYEGKYRNIPKSRQSITSDEITALGDSIRDITRLVNVSDQIAKYEEMLRTGDFATEEKKVEREDSKELRAKKVHLDSLKKMVNEAVYNLRPRTKMDLFREIVTLPRTLMATGDLSGALRQGLVGMFMNPKKYGNSFWKALSATFNQQKADEIDYGIRNHPLYDEIVKLGTHFSNPSSAIANREEMFASNLAEKIPVFGKVVRASERNMITFLNLLRMGIMSDYLMNHPDHTQQTKEHYAKLTNAATGRGTGKVLDRVGTEASALFFAPRFAWSRVQAPLLAVKSMANPEIRTEVAKQWAAMLGTGMVVLALAKANGADVEDDPEDADWGKIVINGDTHIDIWGGLQQPMRVLAKAVKGGAEYAMDGETDIDPISDVLRFLRYKLSPPITMGQELLTGEDIIGNETEPIRIGDMEIPKPASVVLEGITPLVLQSAVEAYKEGKSPAEIAALVSGEGMGLSIGVYDD